VLVSTSKNLSDSEKLFLEQNSASVLRKGFSREDAIRAVEKAFGILSLAAVS
jgi:hypothetical protein